MLARDLQSEPRMDRVWIVRLPDGSVYIAPDSSNDSGGYIYSRAVADMIAAEMGGVVEYSHSVPGR